MSQDLDESTEPVYVSEHHVTEELPEKREGYWRKLGGGSLTISIIVHAIVILVAVLWILESQRPAKEEVQFLPGGGGGGGGGEQKMSQKKQRAVSQTAPKTRIAAAVSNADAVSLPDVSSTLTDMSALSSVSLGGAGLGTGEGIGRG